MGDPSPEEAVESEGAGGGVAAGLSMEAASQAVAAGARSEGGRVPRAKSGPNGGGFEGGDPAGIACVEGADAAADGLVVAGGVARSEGGRVAADGQAVAGSVARSEGGRAARAESGPNSDGVEVGDPAGVACVDDALRALVLDGEARAHLPEPKGAATSSKEAPASSWLPEGAKCDQKGCSWRIHASSLQDNVTMQVKVHHEKHDCSSTRRTKKVKHATKFWIAEKITEWLKDDPAVGTTELQRRIKDKYKVEINYSRLWTGRELAMKNLYGDWEGSFDKLYGWKAEVEKRCPGSLIVIDHMTFKGKIRFTRMFVALKPCIQGFLEGCRPYLAIDSTHLTGKYRGQLATACAVDGHNWLYPVAWGVIDSETNDNWLWFMENVKKAIGCPHGLAICSDAGKGVDNAIHDVFGYAEHKECMRHLVTNFKLKFRGKVFDEHLWPAAYSWTPEEFNEHMAAMLAGNPNAIAYLNNWHKRIWSRSKFSTESKVDYVTNNLAECFNNWIKKHKGLMLYELNDKIRRKLMAKTEKRRKIAQKMQAQGKLILPHIKSELNDKSRGLDLELERTDDTLAEVREQRLGGKTHIVDLAAKTCTCRAWQVSGKPCEHAICFISSVRTLKIEHFVDDCYSVAKFAAAYKHRIPPLTDISQWPKNTHDFYLHPPILKRSAGRQKKERFKGGLEGRGRNGQHQCPLCKGYGHRWNTCKQATPEAKEAYALLPKKRRPKKGSASTSQSVAIATSSSSVLATETAPPDATPLAIVPAASTVSSKNKNNSGSKSGSNNPELSTMAIVPMEEVSTPPKRRVKRKAREVPSPDSPAMGTRSKKKAVSLSMGTRSKRKLI